MILVIVAYPNPYSRSRAKRFDEKERGVFYEMNGTNKESHSKQQMTLFV
jgi:hypothetical protein